MRTIAASELFRLASALHGQPWSHKAGEDSLSLTDFRMLRSILSDRLNTTWHLFPWPVLVIIERRQRVRDPFDYARAYGVGEQVFDVVTNRCWSCVNAVMANQGNPSDSPQAWAQLGSLPYATTNDPEAIFNIGDRILYPVDGNVYYCIRDNSFYADIRQPTQFTPLPDFDPAFPLEDAWQTPMEEVLGVWMSFPGDPYHHLDQRKFTLVDSAVRVEGDPGSAWFRYRIRCPLITGDPWDAELPYTFGDQVYYTDPHTGDGEFWDVINSTTAGQTPDGNPLYWRKVEIPYAFNSYLSWAMHSDWYELDGQADKAGAAAVKAGERLQLEFDKIERQQRQSEPWTVSTR